ncbi:MAG: tRNA (guanosine(46)-N7)-methyltransferase TrmB [Deltaproteobacteria bacterium]|nr:tRNA (guanosine(46)-N7)-methyltransferase TrmB [Deltaproteobacteria bacterium]
MSKRIRHHVNPLSMNYLDFEVKKPLLDHRFTEVELGCAEGEFIFDRTNDKPEHRIIGLEIRRSLIDDINSKAKGNFPAITGVFCNINTHIPRLFPKETVDRFFINFPDPWFKKDHHKRRVVSPSLLSELVSSLKPNGEIFFQSDIFDLAMDAMSVFEEFGPQYGIYNVLSEWSFMRNNPFGTMSRREKYVTEEGLRVWRILYRLG